MSARPALPWLGLLLALAFVAGCGDEDEPAALQAPPPAPTRSSGELPRQPAPKLKRPSGDVAALLDRGTVGVVGLDGRPLVRPERLEFASDATLEDVRWTRWSGEEAVGRGAVRLLDCDPSCAQGEPKRYEATVRLARPKACTGGQFYDRAEVRLERPDDGASEPASFVRAPC